MTSYSHLWSSWELDAGSRTIHATSSAIHAAAATDDDESKKRYDTIIPPAKPTSFATVILQSTELVVRWWRIDTHVIQRERYRWKRFASVSRIL